VRAFVNLAQRSRKDLATDDWQVAALDGILDEAGAALLRLETVKVAYKVRRTRRRSTRTRRSRAIAIRCWPPF